MGPAQSLTTLKGPSAEQPKLSYPQQEGVRTDTHRSIEDLQKHHVNWEKSSTKENMVYEMYGVGEAGVGDRRVGAKGSRSGGLWKYSKIDYDDGCTTP